MSVAKDDFMEQFNAGKESAIQAREARAANEERRKVDREHFVDAWVRGLTAQLDEAFSKSDLFGAKPDASHVSLTYCIDELTYTRAGKRFSVSVHAAITCQGVAYTTPDHHWPIGARRAHIPELLNPSEARPGNQYYAFNLCIKDAENRSEVETWIGYAMMRDGGGSPIIASGEITRHIGSLMNLLGRRIP